MEKQSILIRRFYRSDQWKIARAMKIASAGGRCEMCGAIGTEVHHIIHLTEKNVIDPEVSLNQENLLLLCNECHNKAHHRFGNKTVYSFDSGGNLIPTAIKKESNETFINCPILVFKKSNKIC